MDADQLSVMEALSGKRFLVTGATGFIGKVALAMLLDRRPDVGRVFVLIRPRAGKSAGERFFELICASPAFDSLRERHGDGFEAFLREKIAVVAGDVTLPGWGLSAADLASLEGLDIILNVAGLVSLNPALDDSLMINAHGARIGAELAVALGAKLVHVSTCYVAGLRKGPVSEREPIVGYYPRREGSLGRFDAAMELASADRFISETRAAADRVQGSAKRRAKRQAEERLVVDGRRRARHWGWPNIYCFTKAMGEQLIAATPGVEYAIVRPSIVESALNFPFPGWNEGMTTSAPVILAMCTGHVLWPAHHKAALDVIPVDLAASGLLLAAGAMLLGAHERVYHLSSSDTNPFTVRRCMRYVGEYRRRHYRDHASGPMWLHWLRTRLKLRAVPGAVYHAVGIPAYRRVIERLARALEKIGQKPAPRALKALERELTQVEHIIETFYPFIHDIDCVFKTDHMRAFYGRLPSAERAQIPWHPERIDWRSYWFDVHTEGLRKWVFPGFRDKAKEARPGLGPVDLAIRRLLASAQKALYAQVFRTRIHGAQNVPAQGGYLIAANHASHLDMGLIKHALGHRDLVSLAAKDYFFQKPLRRFFFSRYTNLLPFNRKARLKESLQAAGQVLARGRNLLIFPEGTRTPSGAMLPFKPSLGYLALNNAADILPVYVHGTFEALPKGALLPRSLELAVSVGEPISCAELKRLTQGLPHSEAYRAATAVVEAAVRRLGGLQAAETRQNQPSAV